MQFLFIIISSLLAFVSPIVYSRSILKGQAKPHRTTRAVLLIITALTTASLFVQHNQVAIWLAAVSTVQSIIVFVLSIRYGMGGWSKTDLICLFLALTGIVLWKITHDPVVALYCAIAADFTGMIPALIKTYHHPETDVWCFYLLDSFAAIFSMLALTSWSLQEYSYPVYIMIVNCIMVLLVLQTYVKSIVPWMKDRS